VHYLVCPFLVSHGLCGDCQLKEAYEESIVIAVLNFLSFSCGSQKSYDFGFFPISRYGQVQGLATGCSQGYGLTVHISCTHLLNHPDKKYFLKLILR
jgi:hypothetical protein